MVSTIRYFHYGLKFIKKSSKTVYLRQIIIELLLESVFTVCVDPKPEDGVKLYLKSRGALSGARTICLVSPAVAMVTRL